MFNFSANHLFLLSRTEYRSCAVLLLVDRDTQRVYRLHDFSKTHHLVPGQAYCVAGKVNSADKLYLVIESVRPDTKHARSSNVPVRIRPVNLSITHKFGSLAQDRFDFLCGNVERDVHGALARALPRSASMSLWSLR